MLKLLAPVFFITALVLPRVGVAADAGRFVHALTVYADEQGKSLVRPEGVTCREGTILVADTGNGRLVRYTLANESLGGGAEIKNPQIASPLRSAITSKGEILVLDGKTRQVSRLGKDGKFIGVVEPKGMPEGPSPIIRSFAVDKADNVYLLDVFGERVIVLDPAGQFRNALPLPKGEGFFSDLTVGPQGAIFLIDSLQAVIFSAAAGEKEFLPLGKSLKEYLNFPAAIKVDERGTIYLVDRNGSGVVLLAPDGSYRGRQLTMGWKQGLLYYPSEVCLTGSDEVVIADRDNSRVQIFRINR